MARKKRTDATEGTVLSISLVIVFALTVLAFSLNVLFPVEKQQFDAFLDAASENNISLNGRESNPGADVTIIVYMDYHCPHCKEQFTVLERILGEYFDVVNIAVRHAPARSASQQAAMAAECARNQGSFWEFSSQLFAKTPEGMEGFRAIADNIGLDTGEFSRCMREQETLEVVRSDMQKAKEAGIKGTPTIIINGERIQGKMSYTRMKEKIEDAVR